MQIEMRMVVNTLLEISIHLDIKDIITILKQKCIIVLVDIIFQNGVDG